MKFHRSVVVVGGDELMRVALALRTGRRFDVDAAGKVYLAGDTDGGWSGLADLSAALDDLEAMGWVEVTPAGVVLTERGKWGVEKWFKKLSPAHRRAVERGQLDRLQFDVRVAG